MKLKPQGLSFLLVLLILASGCSKVWAQSIARRVANDLDKIEGYEGQTVEEGILGG
ncbi:MAG: hypothetical protein GY811_20205 [Myxococcales bacterium]|nr:hypothetical protein [Myxococcales bacterium]